MVRCVPLCLLVLVLQGWADLCADDMGPSADEIQRAVAKSLPLLERGAKGSMEQRKQCFTCHNQGLPVLALTAARTRGFTIDADHLQAQLRFTADFLRKNREQYLEGKGQGGQVDTAGYALWALAIGDWSPDETTAAVAEYFLVYQADDDHWQTASRRPPSEQSPFTATFLALQALKRFGTPDQQPRIDARIEQVRQWLMSTPAEDTEDRVFRLRALQLVAAPSDQVHAATDELLQAQRADGGWSQLAEMDSDAYATGSVLVALQEAAAVATDEAAYRNGLRFLIASQLEDGSWHVVSRSKPFQTYFESGYPHGKDQFISIAAAGWATKALVLPLAESP
jgi:N-acyl-D-amino-acid deacylase